MGLGFSHCGLDCGRGNFSTEIHVEQHSSEALCPSGTIFEDSLNHLSNVLDKQLLLFCLTENVAAVRWLIRLGASVNAQDSRGTSCLHAAARSGSLQVVDALLDAHADLEAIDVAHWSPLHVAMAMGRRAVALAFMRAGARMDVRTRHGQVPSDLCGDRVLKTAAACLSEVPLPLPSDAEAFKKLLKQLRPEIADALSQTNERPPPLRFEPFFVPRQPICRLPAVSHRNAVASLGLALFEVDPGASLALLVATGIIRDYPVEMARMMLKHRERISPRAVTDFVCKEHSLSQILRLEILNLIPLPGLGLVRVLQSVFTRLSVPRTLVGLDKLCASVAQVWSRQHQQQTKQQKSRAGIGGGGMTGSGGEPDDPTSFSSLHLDCDLAQRLLFSCALVGVSLQRGRPMPCDTFVDVMRKSLPDGHLAGSTGVLRLLYRQTAACCHRLVVAHDPLSSSSSSGGSRVCRGGGGSALDPELLGACAGLRQALSRFSSLCATAGLVPGGDPCASASLSSAFLSGSGGDGEFFDAFGIRQGSVNGLSLSSTSAGSSGLGSSWHAGNESVPGYGAAERDLSSGFPSSSPSPMLESKVVAGVSSLSPEPSPMMAPSRGFHR
eukprot:Cvel_11667.t1-p1 / transcript=Cvel_11667.t1 / gene=Cvel_11667 / organism=Chromera_velia_CCMP2878 / gene_product=hypothetical protein / transcript_product=hypothetical protein / location=Cvel_scaffold739:67005-70016(+) / protein_length=609 / sequence_SO=supercontig / SO=protein_coding / is_pseudo=false